MEKELIKKNSQQIINNNVNNNFYNNNYNNNINQINNNFNNLQVKFQLDDDGTITIVNASYNTTICQLINLFFLKKKIVKPKRSFTFMFNANRLDFNDERMISDIGIRNLSTVEVH